MGIIDGSSVSPLLAQLLQPPPGGKRVKKISVTPDEKLKIEYEDIPE